ncbi:MAG: helix-turn-helix transcriptional regulator [Kiritimatiellae bacterium]|nr:helix-turn-helix transcriptional regulator [Kiritimatiellia bacterium]
MKKNPVLLALGKNVSELRREKALTQEQLAERSGLDPSYISGIERGVRNPSIISLSRLASGLGTTASEICRNIASGAATKARTL